VLELAVANNIPFREADISEQELRSATEIWLTSSTQEIMPVIELDGVPVDSGAPGPLFQRMMAHYKDYKAAVREGSAR
jgi:D-alanine transaminase